MPSTVVEGGYRHLTREKRIMLLTGRHFLRKEVNIVSQENALIWGATGRWRRHYGANNRYCIRLWCRHGRVRQLSARAIFDLDCACRQYKTSRLLTYTFKIESDAAAARRESVGYTFFVPIPTCETACLVVRCASASPDDCVFGHGGESAEQRDRRRSHKGGTGSLVRELRRTCYSHLSGEVTC